MNLFEKRSPAPSVEHIQQIKQWVHEGLSLSEDIPISVSQLRCHEPDCPPVETVISVMTEPIQVYKIHRSATEIDDEAIRALFQAASS